MIQEENVIPLVGPKGLAQSVRERLQAVAVDMEKLRREGVQIEFNINPDPKTGRMCLSHYRAFRIEEIA